jgi:hypothetical protein
MTMAGASLDAHPIGGGCPFPGAGQGDGPGVVDLAPGGEGGIRTTIATVSPDLAPSKIPAQQGCRAGPVAVGGPVIRPRPTSFVSIA